MTEWNRPAKARIQFRLPYINRACHVHTTFGQEWRIWVIQHHTVPFSATSWRAGASGSGHKRLSKMSFAQLRRFSQLSKFWNGGFPARIPERDVGWCKTHVRGQQYSLACVTRCVEPAVVRVGARAHRHVSADAANQITAFAHVLTCVESTYSCLKASCEARSHGLASLSHRAIAGNSSKSASALF
jgi:hypothetical protein